MNISPNLFAAQFDTFTLSVASGFSYEWGSRVDGNAHDQRTFVPPSGWVITNPQILQAGGNQEHTYQSRMVDTRPDIITEDNVNNAFDTVAYALLKANRQKDIDTLLEPKRRDYLKAVRDNRGKQNGFYVYVYCASGNNQGGSSWVNIRVDYQYIGVPDVGALVDSVKYDLKV